MFRNRYLFSCAGTVFSSRRRPVIHGKRFVVSFPPCQISSPPDWIKPGEVWKESFCTTRHYWNGYYWKRKDFIPCDKEERGTILDKAKEIINGDRQDSYGNPEDSFQIIADLWTTYLRATGQMKEDEGLEPKDVAMLMTLLKIGRETNQAKADNLIDAAGYLGIAGDMLEACENV